MYLKQLNQDLNMNLVNINPNNIDGTITVCINQPVMFIY